VTIKDKDRRRAFWISFVYILTAPIQVHYGMDVDTVKNSCLAVASLGIANYFSKPTGV